jgi:hypothetical protein
MGLWVDRSNAIAKKTNMHKCYGDPQQRTGCWKYVDKDGNAVCKSGYDRDGNKPLVERTAIVDGELQLKRSHPKMHNFNPAFIVALRCNMDIKVVLSGLHAYSLIFYITDYASKPQHSSGVTEDLIKAGIRKYEREVEKARSEGDEQRLEWLLTSRALVIRCLTALNSKVQTSAAETVSYLLHKPMLYKSHDIANVKFSQMLSRIERACSSDKACHNMTTTQPMATVKT